MKQARPHKAPKKNRSRVTRAPAVPEALLNGVRQRRLELASLTEAVVHQRVQMARQQSALSLAQLETNEAERRFSEMYEFVPIPFLMLSDLGIILKANRKALDLFGTDGTWVVGRPLIVYVESKDLKTILTKVYGCPIGQSAAAEVDLRTANGPRRVQILVRCQRSPYGNGISFHLALVDLTAMRHLDAQRRVAERRREQSEEAERVTRAASDAKDSFLAMLSHELRTPLTPILAAADSLISHDSLPPEVIAKIDVIRRNVRAEARLIDDLLDMARITGKRLQLTTQPTDLHRVLRHLRDAWTALVAERDMTLRMRLDAASHWVLADAERLGQVLRNLLGNAIKFSDSGGQITVRTEDYEGRIRVTVTDTGVGMTDKQIEELFTPFARTQDASPRRGLGLGLVISHAIVEAHGGMMQVWSAGPGKGTTVRVEVPAVAEPEAEEAVSSGDFAAGGVVAGAPQKAPQIADHGAPDATTVLLVEDDQDSAAMLAMVLSTEGFRVQVASSLHQANRLADGCDVIVSDIALPDGSGLDLIKEVHSRRPMRAIALSGYGSRQDIDKSLNAGFEEHLTKPVDLEQLVAAVRRLAAPQKA